MALSGNWYIPTRYKLATENGASITPPKDNSNIKLMILTAVPNHQTVEFLDDVNLDEVNTGTGYPAGGIQVTYDDGAGSYVGDGMDLRTAANADNIELDAANMIIPEDTSTGFIDGVAGVIYNNTGTAGSSRIYLVLNANGTFGNSAGPVNINIHANGIWVR